MSTGSFLNISLAWASNPGQLAVVPVESAAKPIIVPAEAFRGLKDGTASPGAAAWLNLHRKGMDTNEFFNQWDLLLVLAVSLQATFLAYVRDPRWKAFILSMPVPFTIACLTVQQATGKTVGASNVAGLVLLLGFTHGVRLLYYRLKTPIIPAIMLAAVGYGVIGWLLAPRLPQGEGAFWAFAVGVMLIGGVVLKLMPSRREQGQRSSLPLWLKLPIIAAVVITLVLLKKGLQGFITVFPMVTVIAAYEARKCLWTISRQIPILMLIVTPMMMVCRLLQTRYSLGLGLLAGWAVLLSLLIPITWISWSKQDSQA